MAKGTDSSLFLLFFLYSLSSPGNHSALVGFTGLGANLFYLATEPGGEKSLFFWKENSLYLPKNVSSSLSGQLLLQKKNHHPGSTVTCPRFSRFFFQKMITKSTHSHTHTHTHACTCTLIWTHTVTMHRHTCTRTHTLTHTRSPTHTHTHTNTHPGEARCLLGRTVSPRLAFQGSAKEMVRLPKGRSSRILPPFSGSGLMYSEDQSQKSEKEVLLLQG